MTTKYSSLAFWLLPFLFVVSLVGLTACGGGSSGGGGGGTTTTTTPATNTSSSSSSGAMGVYLSNGAANAAVPVSSSSGGSAQGEIVTLPNTGTLTASVAISSTQFQALNLPALGVNAVNGLNVDSSHNVGAAFSFNSNALSFFFLSSYKQVGAYTCTTSCANAMSFSGAGPTIGGVVMDPSKQWAIFSTNAGFDIVSYANPSSPTKVRLIPGTGSSSATPTAGSITMTENFAYHPSLTLGGTTYKMILAGGYDSFEMADANTGTIYIPDSATSPLLSGLSNCGVDQIGVDTNYNVAVLGCEFSNNGYLINLNSLTLNASAGTYTLPSSAIYSFPVPHYKMDNVDVESTNHMVFIGGGGYSLNSNVFFVGQLQDPSKGLVFTATSGTTAISMPLSSSSNTSNCTLLGCSPIPNGTAWAGWGDPHSNGAFLDANNDSVVLWENISQNAVAILNLTALQKNSWAPACNPNCNTWYQGLP